MGQVKPLLTLSLVSAILGFIVALGTAFLLGLQYKHLPGGSLGAGLMMGVGWQFSWNRAVPRWMCGLIGGIAGLIGWAISVLLL